MSFARSSIQSKSVEKRSVEPTEEPSVEPTVDPADMRARTLLEMIRDEVAVLELFNSLAAPIRGQDIRTPVVLRRQNGGAA
jgi:hypothetical protein